MLCARIAAGNTGEDRLIIDCSFKEFMINWKETGP